jgi:hypothetical protein
MSATLSQNTDGKGRSITFGSRGFGHTPQGASLDSNNIVKVGNPGQPHDKLTDGTQQNQALILADATKGQCGNAILVGTGNAPGVATEITILNPSVVTVGPEPNQVVTSTSQGQPFYPQGHPTQNPYQAPSSGNSLAPGHE